MLLLFFLDHIHSLRLLIHWSLVAVTRVASLLSTETVRGCDDLIGGSTTDALLKYAALHDLSPVVLLSAHNVTLAVL